MSGDMGLFRRRPRTTAAELARTLYEQIAQPSETVNRSLRVIAQKMQPRAKRDLRTIVLELFYFRAYMMISAIQETLASRDQGTLPRLIAALESDREFWAGYAERARSYDEAIAKANVDGSPDLVLMATFQELLDNPDPDNLLIGLRAWHQFAPKIKELEKLLRRSIITPAASE